MYDTLVIGESKSTADVIFEWLHGEIVTLAILPGSKISEADIARRFDVSRQPVRDAFRRLHNLDLLDIRPQRATVVRRFSLEEIEATRFVRLAVELEVIEGAAQLWDQARSDALAENLDEQSDALMAGDAGLFHELDYGFHKLICDLSDVPKAFET
ncbi:MAG: GntR family transcriptional regulator, partial [Thalassobium sp.]